MICARKNIVQLGVALPKWRQRMGIICFASFLELGKSLEGRPRSGKFRIRLLATICNYDKNNGIKRLPGAVVSSTVWPWESKRSDFFGGWNRVESENIWSHPERGLRREGSCMLNYTVWSPTHRTTSVSDVLFSKMVTFIRRALPKNQLEGHVDFISTGVSEDCWPPNHGSAKHPKMVNLERTVGDNTHTHMV